MLFATSLPAFTLAALFPLCSHAIAENQQSSTAGNNVRSAIVVRGESLPSDLGTNLIPNANFEHQAEGWRSHASKKIVLETAAEDGVIRLTKRGGPEAASFISAPFPVSEGKLILTGLYQTQDAAFGSAAELVLQTATAEGSFGPLPPPPSSPGLYAHPGHATLYRSKLGEWRRKTRSYTIPKGHTAARVIITLEGETGSVAFTGLRASRPGPDDRSDRSLTPEELLSMSETLERLSARPDSQAKVTHAQGAPRLMIDDKASLPFVLMTDVVNPTRGFTSDFARHGVGTTIIPLYNAGQRYWSGKGVYHLDKIDEAIWHNVRRNPEGNFIIYLNLFPYKGWHKDFPNSAAQNRKGEHSISRHDALAPASYWSLEYQEQALHYVRTCIAHINKQPYARAVVGYFITGGEDGQFYYQTLRGQKSVQDGQSPGDLPLFRKWLERRYEGNLAALKKAWNAPDISFSTATAPVENRIYRGVFLDPMKDRPVYDFMTFLNEGLADFLCDVAEVIRKGTPKEIVVGAYYGRGGTFMVYPMFGDTHVMFKRRQLDFIGAQGGYYGWREAGSVGLVPWVYDSTRRANMIPMLELDFRTWFRGFKDMQHDFNVARYWNLDEFKGAMNRDAGRMLSTAGGVWWMEMTGGWFRDDAIMQTIGATHKIGEEFYKTEASYTPAEIALVIDEDTFLWTTEQVNVWNGPQYHALSTQHRAFHQAGVKIDFWYLSDLVSHDKTEYKVYYFLNPYFPSAKTKEFAHRLRKAGKTIVWQYAPGWMTDEGFSLEAMKELTGIAFRHDQVRKEGLRARFVTSEEAGRTPESAELLKGISETVMGGQMDIPADRFVPLDGFDAVLSRFEANGEPAAVLRKEEKTGHVGIVLGHPSGLTPKLFANIAQLAGVHRYTDTGDLFAYHRDDLIVLHGVEGGEKRLAFPTPVNLTEVLEGKLSFTSITEARFPLAPGQTFWFRVEKAAAAEE